MTIIAFNRTPLVARVVCDDDTPVAALKQKLFRELIVCLESAGPTPLVRGNFFGYRDREFLQLFRNGVWIKVRVDWVDYQPLVDNLPVTHYRIEVTNRDAHEEFRISETTEAAQAIAKALEGDGAP